ncbi:MAG: NUDIX domain-containing protein [Polyangiaceae bacterium]
MSPRIAVVSADNRFERWADRREVHAHHLPHRSVQILLFNRAGELLLQKRHRDKLTYPSSWDLSCAGHVEEPDYPAGPDDDLDSVYDAVALRELTEELGVTASLTRLARFAPEPGVHYEQLHLYRAEHEGPFVLQEDEVEEVRFVSPEAFDAMVREARETIVPALVWFVRWAREHAGLFLPRAGGTSA